MRGTGIQLRSLVQFLQATQRFLILLSSSKRNKLNAITHLHGDPFTADPTGQAAVGLRYSAPHPGFVF